MTNTKLKEAIWAAIDRAADTAKREVAALLVGAAVGKEGFEPDDEPIVSTGEATEYPWHIWPNGQKEEYTSATWYEATTRDAARGVIVARTVRPVWGRPRGRIVVFGQEGTQDSKQYYPWAEFAETDESGLYAATLPDPERPRGASLKDDQPLPERYRTADVRRTDTVFESVRQGPSLRLVVAQDDEKSMIAHAFWVARLPRA